MDAGHVRRGMSVGRFCRRPTLDTACRVGRLAEMLGLLIKHEPNLSSSRVYWRESLSLLTRHLMAHVAPVSVNDAPDATDRDSCPWLVDDGNHPLSFLTPQRAVAAAC